MAFYMAVTADEYELPIIVADTGAELARIVGIPKLNVYSAISKGTSGKLRGYKIVKVEED